MRAQLRRTNEDAAQGSPWAAFHLDDATPQPLNVKPERGLAVSETLAPFATPAVHAVITLDLVPPALR